MKKHLFLTGPSGSGKTTLIKNALGDRICGAGGFVTERVLNDNGSLLGFDLLPASAAGGVQGFEPLRILDYTVSPPKANTEVFRNDAAQLLDEAQYYPFSVVDEFGGFELIVPQFRAKLAEFLSYDQPCIGVLKTLENAEQLRCRLGLGEKYTAYARRLREALECDEDTLILEISHLGDKNASDIVHQWVREYVGE